jgi:predicted nucleic acid-binding Zn ribbon protein
LNPSLAANLRNSPNAEENDMPTYVYQEILEDGGEGECFEIVQKMSDDPLTTHPDTGRPVRRMIPAPRFTTKYSDAHDKSRLSDSNLKSKGFTKYVKSDDGKYEKVLGSGPDLLNRDQ